MDARLRDRPTPPHAFGVLPVWSMGLALGVCLIMIIVLLGLIVVQGTTTFWPQPIERVTLHDDTVLYGVPIREESDEFGGSRRLYRVGNRDFGGRPFRWVALDAIAEIDRPAELVMLEREEWGVFLGVIEGVTDSWPSESFGDMDRPDPDRVAQIIRSGRERRHEMESLRAGPIASVNHEIGRNRQELAEAQLRASQPRRSELPRPLWIGTVVLAAAAGVVALVGVRLRLPKGVLPGVIGVAVVAGSAAWLERPGPDPSTLAERLTARTVQLAQEREVLLGQFEELTDRLQALERADAVHRLVVRAADGRIAPASPSAPNEPMLVSDIVRAVRGNELSPGDRVGVYLGRWAEFVGDAPREANTEGGVFPVIVGTLLVTLLLTVAVVPLGVLAALYIREYARQGPLVSALRIAINNLAGVPSIVYGVFGLGFFCYAVGGFIDGGPSVELPKPTWWVAGVLVMAGIAGAVVLSGRRAPGQGRAPKWVVGGLWAVSLSVALVLAATSPYFEGFFRVKLLDGEPTFGSSGLLWASLTLALLTLPVVIVSTEEAIAAVPPSLREGSYGCGASRWQTIRRVVLPGAMPGVMTGAILAIARGAGEVAPLMVVGAVKLAPELPVGAEFPFIFADRSFMHLGFHIFDLGFQSPDSEAARGMVWTTTLLLITLVVAMNLAAILIRARLRSRLSSGHF